MVVMILTGMYAGLLNRLFAVMEVGVAAGNGAGMRVGMEVWMVFWARC